MSESPGVDPFAGAEAGSASEGNLRRIVYVVDDNVDVRKSLHFALEPSGITVWPFGSPQDFLDELDALKPAPILLDIRMPKIDGIQLLEMIRDRGIDWPVIMMTAHGDVPIAVTSMKLGAFDFIEKPFSLDELEKLLTTASSRLEETVAVSQRREDARARLASLTPREDEVMRKLTQGLPNKVIGSELGISPRTVEIHRAALLTKLKVKSTAGLMRLLVDAGEV